MRRVFPLIVVLFGAGLAFGYPLLAARLPSAPRASYPVYSPASGVMPVEISLNPENAPFRIYLDLTVSASTKFDDRAVLTLTVSTSNQTVLAKALTFEDAAVMEDTPQTPQKIFRAEAGTIDARDPASVYSFIVGPGDAEGIALGPINLVIESGPKRVDSRVKSGGLVVMAIGMLALLLSLRTGSGAPPTNPNSQPPPPRWGRGADRR